MLSDIGCKNVFCFATDPNVRKLTKPAKFIHAQLWKNEDACPNRHVPTRQKIGACPWFQSVIEKTSFWLSPSVDPTFLLSF